MSLSIPENLEKVRQLISLYEEKYGRSDKAVQLIAVSKTHGADKVKIAYQGRPNAFRRKLPAGGTGRKSMP